MGGSYFEMMVLMKWFTACESLLPAGSLFHPLIISVAHLLPL